MNKMTRSATIIRRILTVLLWAAAILVGIAIVATLLILFFAPDHMMQDMQVSLTLGNMSFC